MVKTTAPRMSSPISTQTWYFKQRMPRSFDTSFQRGRRRFGILLMACAAVFGTSAAFPLRDAAAEAPSRRAWLGIELEKGPAGGVVAKHVITNSPAGKAGIADGDMLVSVDGEPLDETKQLVAKVAIVGPNNSIKLKVRHSGVEKDVSVVLAPHPGADQILKLDKVGTFAPGWKEMTTVSGSIPANIGKLRGKVVVLDFWASFCGPCKMIAPELTRMQKTYGAQGLAVIGITNDSVDVAAKASQAFGMRYAIGSDTNEQMQAAYSVRALPTMFIIDKKGVIRDVVVGFDPGQNAEVEKLIKTLLAEPAPADVPSAPQTE